ncbi:zinc finger protein [Loa loa]|uniref:Zinc finger protein n=1 Tax=Loa loa TaxID=7209 RepID=A0A1S0TUZ2_LOALO|nr:zinc finger protein [Loa loa]EFO19906.1 zinc finger protein [Loa loa]
MRIHTGEKPSFRSECKMNFIDSSNLRRHIKTHTDEKLYTCSNMRSHRNIHDNDRPRFNYTVCNKAFLRKSYLNSHMKNHTLG